MLPIYKLSIDDIDSENGEYLGVMEIANTANPAIQIKGIALSEVKQMIFKDELKYQIASPVLAPGKVFRRDPDTSEEYYVDVTPEIVEQMFMKFQKDRSGKDVFNVEHDESKRVPSFILETWLVENPKQDKSFSTYGIECPTKTWFAVQQFTDKQAYLDCVESGQIGFSIHGSSAMKFTKQEIIKQINMSKKKKFVAQFTSAVGTDEGEVIVTADVLEVGAEVTVLDADFAPVDNFSGSVTIEDATIVITDNVITEMPAEEIEVELAAEEPAKKDEKPADVPADVPAEVPAKKDEVPVELAVEPGAVETYTKAEVDAKFDEVYAMLAEMKTTESKAEEVVMADEPKKGMDLKMSKIELITNFIKTKK